jgi:hypothetical protein
MRHTKKGRGLLREGIDVRIALAYLAALLSADAQRTVRRFYLIRTFRLRPSRETRRTFGRFDGDAACRSVGIVDELVELNARLRADFEMLLS